jgi:UDP-N-acetylglucosamine transferase subunit ALG13
MIFVTVGTQLAFERLISAVDEWAANSPSKDIFSQIGPSKYTPLHMPYSDFLKPDDANKFFVECDLVVSHAGMGSILTALKYKKPILILPRLASLNEHRNNHQVATAKWLQKKSGVTVAWSESELVAFLDARDRLVGGAGISDDASDELIERIRVFIDAKSG